MVTCASAVARTTATEASTGKSATLTVHLHPEIVAKIDSMEKLVAQPDNGIVIVDARPAKRFAMVICAMHNLSTGKMLW
jgi:3-mercaptopyruvate sulfurtransferase SseA